MISPHLLEVKISYSSCIIDVKNEKGARRKVRELWGEDRPILVLPTTNKDPKWCHIVWAKGPPLTEDSVFFSNLIIIWWSEMGPDTERVLSAIDWEKHARDAKAEEFHLPL